jgi:PAS domain S-box-containing protein
MVGILGYTIEELYLQSFVPMTHPEDVDKSVGLLRQMLNGEIHSFQMIKRYLHKHGHLVR